MEKGTYDPFYFLQRIQLFERRRIIFADLKLVKQNPANISCYKFVTVSSMFVVIT